MKLKKSLLAVGVALAVLSASSSAHAVYQKVETFELRYAMVDSSDCSALSFFCTEVFISFGFDESDALQKFAVVEVYDVDLTGPVATYTLVAEGSWWDAGYSVFIASNRKTATFSGYVELDTGPCDQVNLTCSGPANTPLVQSSASATSAKAGALKKSTIELPPCKITRTGTYNLRRSKVGLVSLNSSSYVAFPTTGSVVIEKDNVKLTSTNCLALNTARPLAVQQHLDGRAAPLKHLRRRA